MKKRRSQHRTSFLIELLAVEEMESKTRHMQIIIDTSRLNV